MVGLGPVVTIGNESMNNGKLNFLSLVTSVLFDD